MSGLTQLHCVACRAGEPTVTEAELSKYQPHVPDWQLSERAGIPRLERVFAFGTFADALQFTNAVGGLAEAQGHHPALLTEWGKVTVTWWTHSTRRRPGGSSIGFDLTPMWTPIHAHTDEQRRTVKSVAAVFI